MGLELEADFCPRRLLTGRQARAEERMRLGLSDLANRIGCFGSPVLLGLDLDLRAELLSRSLAGLRQLLAALGFVSAFGEPQDLAGATVGPERGKRARLLGL
jgi:hypothetical protein